LTTSKPRASAAFESASTQLAAKLPQEVLMGSQYGDLSALMFLVVTRVEFIVWVVHGGALARFLHHVMVCAKQRCTFVMTAKFGQKRVK
jgi:hypothetical protein